MNFDFMVLLPFWILGVPLVVAVLSYFRLPKHSEIVRRSERRRN